MTSLIIEAKGVTKIYRSRSATQGTRQWLRSLVAPRHQFHKVLDGVDLFLRQGECLGLLGANGAGKSTFIKILCGIQLPSSGEVRVLGNTPSKRRLDYLRRIGVVFGHKTSLWWDLPIRQSFEISRRIYDIDHTVYKRNLAELCDALGISQLLDRPVRVLSLGERVKAELAMNLLHGPSVVFLDEPTVGLYIDAKAEIRAYLNAVRDSRGLAIFLTSHDMGDIDGCCDRMILLNNGCVRYDGEIEAFKREFQHEARIKITPTGATYHNGDRIIVQTTFAKFGLAPFTNELNLGQTVTVSVPKESANKIIAALVECIDVRLEVRQPTLEELLLERFRSWKRNVAEGVNFPTNEAD